MKALSKVIFAVSLFSLAAMAQAEGVSQEDIEAGNHPYTESSVEKSED